MKSILTTAVFWLVLVYAKIPLAERITEAAALAVAIVLTFMFYGVLDLIATPAREDKRKSTEIVDLSKDLRSHTDRAELQRYFASFAVIFKDLEKKLSSKEIDADEFMALAQDGFDTIERDIAERPDRDFIKYRIYDKSAANTLGPSMIPMLASNLVGKLGLDNEKASQVSEYLWYRQNLDGLISNLAG